MFHYSSLASKLKNADISGKTYCRGGNFIAHVGLFEGAGLFQKN